MAVVHVAVLVAEVVASLEDSMHIQLTQEEAQSYYDAADALYDMYIEAADYVIENELFFEVGVPFNLIEAIKKSWENDVHWHIYGAFHFSGGTNGEPITLQKFDADTPSGLMQTSQEQREEYHFNEIYEKVRDNFKRLITLDGDINEFDTHYDGWKILFSAPSDDAEKENTSKFLEHLAQEAGFETKFSYLHEVDFSDDSISDSDGIEYEYWFKNYSWREMASQEPELLTTLTTIMNKQNAIILNPAYIALFEAEGMLDILKKLYPDAPYLQNSNSTAEPTAKVFFAYEACGVSFSTQTEAFIPHTIV